MKFTDGNDRFFEKMMQEVPNFNKRKYTPKKEQRNNTKFKYTFAHLDCKYCNSDGHCTHKLCPHIMRNLGDLKTDVDFLSAVENAENCKTAHKRTLLHVRENKLCE